MKKKKRIMRKVSILLLITLVCGILPVPALAAGATVPEGKYHIVSGLDSDILVDVSGNGTADCTNIGVWSRNGTTAQDYSIEHVSGEWYRIVHVASGKVIDVRNGERAAKVGIWLYTYNSTDAQFWRFISDGNGGYYIQNKLGYYLDVQGGNIGYNGTDRYGTLWVYELNKTASQVWYLENINPEPTMYVQTAGGSLNMRSGAGTNYSIVTKLANGTAVTVYSISDGWATVSANGKKGYVSTQFLSSTAASSSTTTTASTWRYPMENTYCTWTSYSNMSWATYTYTGSGRNYHLGIDIYGTNGAVYAASAGTVVATSSSNSGANGRYVIIQHSINGKTVYSFYAHLASVSVSKGQSVTTDTQIGVAGGSGYGSNDHYGTHLHFAIVDTLWSNGRYYGYSTYFSGNKRSFGDVTYYSPVYVISNGKLP